MWDLDTLQYLNERAVQAHLREVARTQEASQNHDQAAPTAPVFPLAILSRRLITGPPSLAYILELLEDSEIVAYFMELVSEYLPDREAEIRAADVDDRTRLFCIYFEQHYFPLVDVFMEEAILEDFIKFIPVELMGFSGEDYQDFVDFRTGFILLLSLIENPFFVGDESDGERVTIIAHVSDVLGRDIAGLIPKNGLTPEQLHELTDGTKFEGVGIFADWVHSQTGCWILDANYSDFQGEGWDPETVRTLTEQWPRVCEIQDKKANIIEYIEENPKKRFVELLNILLDVDVNEFVVPDEQMPLPLGDKGQVIST